MNSRMTACLLSAAIGASAIACTTPVSTPANPDRNPNITAVSWKDGKPAFAITCSAPQKCQQLAHMVCGSGYTVLQSENMPVSAGNARYISDKASTTIRCQ